MQKGLELTHYIQAEVPDELVGDAVHLRVEQALSGAYDVMLMDVQIPVMDGFEATAAIRRQEQAQGGHLHLIGLTARAQSEDRQRC